MSSRGHTAIAALAVVAAMLAALAGPAGAASPGLNGYVTDAGTGLPVAGATVSWLGPMTPAPTATTDANGRYMLSGLEGSTGTLAVTGPAGYDRTQVADVAIAPTATTTRSVPLERDWAATAGGATATATDETGAEGGAACGSGAALDTDRTTGWSASAKRPAGDAPTLTVQLPQTIDVRGLVLHAGAACGHADGAALGRYRIETSPDGTAWTTAAEGELGESARGVDTAVTPTAGASGVRFVRLVLLSAQSAGSATIDVPELAVHGVGPNTPPSGSVSSLAPRNLINSVVRLRASFTDPDSVIVRYLWDFDGDGAWDQATAGPQVAHVWAGSGSYHVIVGARDFRGGLGTAAIDLRIVDPEAPLEPIIQRKPLVTFDPPEGIDLSARIACSSRCVFVAKFVVTKKLQRKLKLKRRTLRTWKKHAAGGTIGSFTLTLPQTTIKKLRKAKMRKVNVRVTATAVDQQGRRTTLRRWVTFR